MNLMPFFTIQSKTSNFRNFRVSFRFNSDIISFEISPQNFRFNRYGNGKVIHFHLIMLFARTRLRTKDAILVNNSVSFQCVLVHPSFLSPTFAYLLACFVNMPRKIPLGMIFFLDAGMSSQVLSLLSFSSQSEFFPPENAIGF